VKKQHIPTVETETEFGNVLSLSMLIDTRTCLNIIALNKMHYIMRVLNLYSWLPVRSHRGDHAVYFAPCFRTVNSYWD